MRKRGNEESSAAPFATNDIGIDDDPEVIEISTPLVEQPEKKSIKLKQQNNSPFVTALVVFPPQFVFSLLQTAI